MSYILDALKKSEQARLNAALPSQHVLLRVDEASYERRAWPYWVGAILLLNAAALYVWLRSPAGAIVEPKVNVTAEALPRQPAPTATATIAPRMADDVPRPATSLPAAAAKPSPLAAPATNAVPPAPPASTTAVPAAVPASDKAEAAARVRRAALATAAAGAVAPPPRVVSDVAPAASGVQVAGDMPDALRRELPPLAVSGVMREQGGAGWAVVNERPVREGDEIAPGLRVEKILEHNVQFSYKGYRFQR